MYDDVLAVALWIMFTWVHETAATHSPILLLTSAQPESGKSTTLGLIKFLAPRCVASVEISEAALYRAIQVWRPSFAIDEFDSVLFGDDKASPARSAMAKRRRQLSARRLSNAGGIEGVGITQGVLVVRRPARQPASQFRKLSVVTVFELHDPLAGLPAAQFDDDAAAYCRVR
jgi:hypothetical protein